MLYTYIVTLLLPSVFSYKINVKGSIDFGDQVAEVFKGLRDRFLEGLANNNERQQSARSYKISVAQNSAGMPVPQDFPFLNNIPIMEKTQANDVHVIDSYDVPLLEEIVSQREDMVHVYGKGNHGRIGKKKRPRNKIVV